MTRPRLILTLVVATLFAMPGGAHANTFPVIICGASARVAGDGLTSSSGGPLAASVNCPQSGLGLGISAPGGRSAANNTTGAFAVTAPPGVSIYSIHVADASSTGMGHDEYGSSGWWGEFYWNGGPGPAGRSGPLTDSGYNAGGCCSQTNLQSRTVGWFLACNQASCSTGNSGIVMNVGELDLTAEEDTGPSALPTTSSGNLWTQAGWVRGTWPASLVMSDPSGVCSSDVVLGQIVVKAQADETPNRHTFAQCNESSLPASFNTASVQTYTGVGAGYQQLALVATNAAGVSSIPKKIVAIDNTTPTISLTGPTDAPSSAGTQYVTATASPGPSGIASIDCTVDGGPPEVFSTATARVPVSGVGTHTVSCYAENNAVDPSGVHGQSQTAGWTLKIGQPTEVGIGFTKFVGGLHCARTRVRVRVPGRWVTVHRHGDPVWVKTPTRTKTELVVRCHPQTALRRTVAITHVKRHGKVVTVRRVKVERVVIPPHVVSQAAKSVAFGTSTVVSGWLGTAAGTGLAGHPVNIIAAPDNGSGAFTVVARTTTAADGSWSARLPAGPSRVVEARYDGDTQTEAAGSSMVHVVVPARIRLLSVTPSHVRWGGTVRITGQLEGGFLPTGGALVRLRIGIGRSYQTYGVEHVSGDGRFTTTYTFGLGEPSVRRSYFFQLATLPEGDYPYASGASGRRTVTVGGNG